MYNDFEKYLSGYLPTNYWYDEGVDIAQDMISDFKDDDWNQLLKRLCKQNIEWKKKLAYCLYDDGNKYQLLTLLKLIETEDEELLEISLDSLRDFVNKEIADFFINNSKIIRDINQLYYKSSKPTQVILADLINKINEFTEDKLTLIDSQV